MLDISKLVSANPAYYELQNLTDPQAPENQNGRKKYETPLQIQKPGKYEITLFASDSPNDKKILQKIIFWVYVDAPTTTVKFYAPFIHGKGGFIVGGKSKIGMVTQNTQSAIDYIQYRIYKTGDPSGEFKKYEDEIEVNSFAHGQSGSFTFEYKATDVAGNEEASQKQMIHVDAKGPEVSEISATEGKLRLKIFDENFPVVVRIYEGDRLIEDRYFRFFEPNEYIEFSKMQGVTIKAIDLLGNETILQR